MQKKLIALAVAGLVAAPAFAQSNVTITGIAAISVTNSSIGNTNAGVASKYADENRLDDQTSRFTLKGSEDLGNGMSAYFQMENRVSLDARPGYSGGKNLSGLTDGESFVGIKHNKLGQVGFGKYALHYHEFLGYSESYRALNNQSLASVSILSAVNGAWIANNSRTPNTIKYDTPTFFGGLSGKLAYSFSPLLGGGNAEGEANGLDDRYEQGRAWQAAVRYYTGPINAFVSYFDQTGEGVAATTGANAQLRMKQKSVKLGADYTFKFGLKVGFGFDRSIVRANAERTGGIAGLNLYPMGDGARSAWMIPVSYTFGANAVYLTYAKAADTKGAINNTSDNTGATQYTLAYDRALSKRTFVGVSYIALKNQSKGQYSPFLAGNGTGSSWPAAATGGLSWRQLGFNMTHFF